MCVRKKSESIQCSICEKLKTRNFIFEFDKDKYNFASNYVKRMTAKVVNLKYTCFICSTCVKKLTACNMAACALCKKVSQRKQLRFMQRTPIETYALVTENSGVNLDNGLAMEGNDNNCILVCVQCRSNIDGKVRCVMCDNMKMKHTAIKFKREKYCKNRLSDTIVSASECDQICKVCDQTLMHAYTCTCCHNRFDKDSVILFDVQNYDLGNYIVSCAL